MTMDEPTIDGVTPDIRMRFSGWSRGAAITGIVGLVAAVAAALVFGKAALVQSYLFAYLFWLGISLGCLSAMLLHQLVAGGWGYMIQRVAEAATRVLPFLALAFAPILLAYRDLYPWADPNYLIAHPVVAEKTAYLNTSFFVLRAVIYFAIFIGLAAILNHWSRKLDLTGDAIYIVRLRRLGAIGLIFYVLAMTFASVDWGMSLEPEQFSSIYGAWFIVGQGLLAIAFCTIIVSRLYRSAPYVGGFGCTEDEQLCQMIPGCHGAPGCARPKYVEYFHHLGNLLLGFVVLWAYISFSQYLIIWSGNLPEEIPYYINRTHGGYQALTVVLILFHFVVPFAVLLIRRSKRSIPPLVTLCGFMLLMRAVDLFWIIIPAFRPGLLLGHLLIGACLLVGLGGIWMALFFRELTKRPLLPVGDERMRALQGHHDPAGTDTALPTEATEHA